MSKKSNGVMSIFKDTFALVIITLVAVILLGLVNDVTSGVIGERKRKEKQEAYGKVLPGLFDVVESDGDGELSDAVAKAGDVLGAGLSKVTINDACIAKNEAGNVMGYILTVTDKEGFGGDIQMLIGFDINGSITGINFLVISETPGFGMKAKEDASWKEQYYNKTVAEFSVVKTGAANENEIDAIGGATITSNAITNGVNGGLKFAKYLTEQEIGGSK